MLELRPRLPHSKRFPVIEVFGPTIQGEGFLAGMSTYFVRFGGCDYRCKWCDSMHAVEPAEVRAHSEWLTADEIVERLMGLGAGPFWVTLSGGNPALHRLGYFVGQLHEHGYYVTVETQGSVWRDWLGAVDHLTVSPKPPSSGMVSDELAEQTERFLAEAVTMNVSARSLKFVVFDEVDYLWARDMIIDRMRREERWFAFLSVGTDLPERHGSVDLGGLSQDDEGKLGVARRYRWLCERTARDAMMAGVRVLPQLHVIAWGHARGV